MSNSNDVIFSHPYYDLVNDDKIVRKTDANIPVPTRKEDAEVLAELARYVEAKIVNSFGFSHIPIPSEDAIPSTSILASSNWTTASKLLLIIQNASGSQLGIFSRSLCMDKGLSKGSMLPYIERAIAAEYGILILRPNANSIVEELEDGKINKIIIPGSESPEIHSLCVWENIVSKAENVNHIALLGYGNGAAICKDLLLRQMVRSKEDETEVNRIKAFITIEASTIIENDDAGDIKDFMNSIAINLECNQAPKGYRLKYRKEKLGCTSLSVGLPANSTEVLNVAESIPLSLNSVFKYLEIAENGGNVASIFADAMAKAYGHVPATAEIQVNPQVNDDLEPVTPNTKEPPEPAKKPGFFARLFGSNSKKDVGKDTPSDGSISVNDFDLLKIVGKGAFGKVMLVRKKNGIGSGQIYAMKVLKKSVVAAKGQIENTMSEREILCEIRHPFIVRLRFAFQSDDKLYLVTDYYNGGTLFYHLRKARAFTEERAKFYAAELLLALDHLHSQHIIYRDLKLENVLLDHLGHVALTDFGLSKQDIDKSGGASTFCGTAEYIAPELLQVKRYGKAVDWWSFGILMYVFLDLLLDFFIYFLIGCRFEMMYGRTPFYDKNRKVSFVLNH